MKTFNSTKLFSENLSFYIIVLLVSIANINSQKTFGQVVRKIPNPDFTGSVNYYIYSYPIVYNNKLYVNYSNFLLNDFHIAEYDGTTLKTIPNPNNQMNDALGAPVIYNNKLYYPYGGVNFNYQFAQFDGSNISLIPNPTNGVINVNVKPIIYNQKLYTFYSDNSSTHTLSYTDGTSLTIDTIVKGKTGVHTASDLLTLYNNQLTLSDSVRMITFNGTSTNEFNNPADFIQAVNQFYYQPVLNKNKLYVDYISISTGTHHLTQFDGTNVNVIPNINSQDDGYAGFGFTFNNQVYFLYNSTATGSSQLGKYDGNSISLVPTPIAGQFNLLGYNNYQVTYHNNLYILFKDTGGVTYLTKYDGNNLVLLTNPDEGNGFNGSLFVYNDKIYSSYVTASGTNKLITYDGSSFKYIPSSDGSNVKFVQPIIYNNNLYFSSGGNLAYVDTSILPVLLLNFSAQSVKQNVILKWQTATETNTNFFNIQRSGDGVHFNTISKVMAAGNSSNIKTYSYSDVGINELGLSKLYYRLQEVDKDGKSNYSDVKTINLSNGHSLFSVSPNPSKDFINIVSSYNVTAAQVNITDMNGKILFTSKQDFIAGQQLKVSLSRFPSEVLIVSIINNDNHQQFKILKE